MAYVLIILVSISSGGGPATAEFADKAACEKALAVVLTNAISREHIRGWCLPKATSS